MPQHPIGEIVIQRIVESICTAFKPLSFFPETTPDDWARHRTWMEPRALDPVSGNLVLPIQGFLVRTRRHTILIDTCVGHDKSRPQRLFWHMKKFDTFLPRLAAAGVRPEDVDYVMCTHLHSDHVGWNTQLRDGRWVPTFPNAKYIFSRGEWEGFEALHRKHPQPQFLDSVLPIMEARQAEPSAATLRWTTKSGWNPPPAIPRAMCACILLPRARKRSSRAIASTVPCNVWNRDGSCAPILTRRSQEPRDGVSWSGIATET